MIILGLDKRINKRIQKSFKKEDEYNYNPAPTYNNVEDIPQSQQNQNPSFNSFEEMLNQVDEPTPTFHARTSCGSSSPNRLCRRLSASHHLPSL